MKVELLSNLKTSSGAILPAGVYDDASGGSIPKGLLIEIEAGAACVVVLEKGKVPKKKEEKKEEPPAPETTTTAEVPTTKSIVVGEPVEVTATPVPEKEVIAGQDQQKQAGEKVQIPVKRRAQRSTAAKVTRKPVKARPAVTTKVTKSK